ncbi:MAG TPA: CBS domain-containing protein [Vicinamibacterales bacterium]|nr:CBS domain-containing protein [Vicinamibacterales bacterium]
MRIVDVMKKPVHTAPADELLATAATRMHDKRIRHLVVTRDGKAVGLLSSRDVGPRGEPVPGAGAVEKTVGDAMTYPVVMVTPETTLRQAANLMRGRSIGCLPVEDGDRLVGIVTVSDLLTLIGTGAERPVTRGERWTLKHRGQRPRRPVPR